MSGSSAQTDRKHLAAIVIAFAAVYIIWGTTYLVIRIAIETIPPFLMAGSRFLVAGAFIFTIMRLRGAPLPQRLHWRSAVIIGGLLILGGSGMLTWSEQQVPSSTAALVVATVPLWMALFDWLIFKGSRPGRRVTLGLFLGLIGIILLVLALILFIRSVRHGGYLILSLRSEQKNAHRGAAMRVGLTLALSLIYAIGLLGHIDYTIGTLLYIFVFIVLFEYRWGEPVSSQLKVLGYALLQALIASLLLCWASLKISW